MPGDRRCDANMGNDVATSVHRFALFSGRYSTHSLPHADGLRTGMIAMPFLQRSVRLTINDLHSSAAVAMMPLRPATALLYLPRAAATACGRLPDLPASNTPMLYIAVLHYPTAVLADYRLVAVFLVAATGSSYLPATLTAPTHSGQLTGDRIILWIPYTTGSLRCYNATYNVTNDCFCAYLPLRAYALTYGPFTIL